MEVAQAKQDAALTIMELKEKIQAMYKAVQSPREESTPKTPSGDSEHISPDSTRHILIVELSSQVSVQQEKIHHLESILQSRDAKIKHLEAECLSRRSMTPILLKESKNPVNADHTPEDQRSLADHTQGHNYMPDTSHAQDYQHIMNAEAPNEFKQAADFNTTLFEHNVDPDNHITFEPLEDANINKKYEKVMETDISQDSKLIVDDDCTCKSPSKIDADFNQNVDSEFSQKSEYNENADISQSLEEAGLTQEYIEKQSKDSEDNNRDDSNGELEKLLNQISNENSSHDGTQNTPSPDNSLLTNSAGSKTMPTSSRLSEKDSPSPSESHEDAQHSVNEVFIFGSDHIGNNEECVKLDEEDLF